MSGFTTCLYSNFGQNNPKTPLLVMFPPEKLKPKTKKFFFRFWLQDLLNP